MSARKLKAARLTCTACGKELQARDFYMSNSFMFTSTGRLSVCKSCVLVAFQNFVDKYVDIEVATYYTCRLFDVYFGKEVYNAAYEQSKEQGSHPMQIYFQKVNSLGQYAGKTFSDTIDEERLLGIKAYTRSRKEELTSTPSEVDELDEEDDERPYMTLEESRKFWGNISRFTEEDYDYLNTKFFEYINAYECETPVMEELLKQAALQSLEIMHLRREGKETTKSLKALQDILGSANIKPNQETGANAAEQTTFGTLIKKWENEEPIPEPDPEWADVDGIGKYIRIWFLGHLCKMLGIENEFSKEYEAEMAKFRVELPEDVFEDDAEVDA